MPKSAFVSRLLVSTSKPASSLSGYLRPCYTNFYSRRYHQYKTSLDIDSTPFAKNYVRTVPSPSSSGPRRIIQYVRIASRKLKRDCRRLSASSRLNAEPTDIDRPASHQPATVHSAMIALGSNIGDRVSMIEQACEKMPSRGIIVKATSFLYETAPMYVTDQASFCNGVCEVRNYGSIT